MLRSCQWRRPGAVQRELGVVARPLTETLADAIAWHRWLEQREQGDRQRHRPVSYDERRPSDLRSSCGVQGLGTSRDGTLSWPMR